MTSYIYQRASSRIKFIPRGDNVLLLCIRHGCCVDKTEVISLNFGFMHLTFFLFNANSMVSSSFVMICSRIFKGEGDSISLDTLSALDTQLFRGYCHEDINAV